MNSATEPIVDMLYSRIPFFPTELEAIFRQIRELTDEQFGEVIEGFCDKLEEIGESQELNPHARGGLAHTAAHLAFLSTGLRPGESIQQKRRKIVPAALLKRLYNAIPASQDRMRGLALQMIAVQCEQDDLEAILDVLEHQPPQMADSLLLGLSPLFKIQDWPVEAFFPAAFRTIQHQHLASVIIDLANYVATQRKLPQHPGYPRRKELIELLGAIVQRLEQFEENPRIFGDEVPKIQEKLRESISLAVSLCYCVGLIGDEAAVGKLNQASELMHRHVQAEAFGALARLGADHGRKELIALAKEPSARLRVIQYAKELGLDDLIAPKFLTDEARAEAELAVWLSEPIHFSVPPTNIELIDHRELFWPGYTEVQNVYLFRFHYDLGASSISNIGISGPLTYAFGADMADLPIEDIYAAFAGWHMEHPDVHEFAIADLPRLYDDVVKPLQRKLKDAGHTKIKNVLLGIFFREPILVSESNRGKLRGIAVVSQNDMLWFPTTSRTRPMTAKEAYSIYKGRIVLKSFNEALGNAWRNSEEFPEPIDEDDNTAE